MKKSSVRNFNQHAKIRTLRIINSIFKYEKKNPKKSKLSKSNSKWSSFQTKRIIKFPNIPTGLSISTNQASKESFQSLELENVCSKNRDLTICEKTCSYTRQIAIWIARQISKEEEEEEEQVEEKKSLPI